MPVTLNSQDDKLITEVACYYSDPLGFVLDFFPWGKGQLEGFAGPDKNQKDFLTDLGKQVKERKFDGHTPVMPILMAETSGHGTGKSAMGAWITWWILSTRPASRGTVTAGTYAQLDSRTWAAIQWWGRQCYTCKWFDIQAHGIYSIQDPDNWNVVAQTCKEENAQSFAGQHAITSTSWYLFDEASEVPDKIWETATGGLTDGEPMFFAWGQCVRNTGQFFEVCFGSQSARWDTRRIDSRTSQFTNKSLIDQWLGDYGEDSDYFRVRVLGMAPTASELQFIDWDRIREAQKREARSLHDDPILAGFDVSGGGNAWNVIRFRKGYDGNVLPAIRIPGEFARDRDYMVSKCAEVLRDSRPGHFVRMMFVDSAFGAPIVERLRVLGYQDRVMEVNFGGRSPDDKHCLNMRAFMWSKAKDWLPYGAIDPKDLKLGQDLAGPGASINRAGKLVLESKQDMMKRGQASPDDGDAFVLTFAAPIGQYIASEPERYAPMPRGVDGWMAG